VNVQRKISKTKNTPAERSGRNDRESGDFWLSRIAA